VLGPGVLDVPSPDVGLDVKFGFNDLCPVCGDKVSGFHYGLLTCESCKGTYLFLFRLQSIIKRLEMLTICFLLVN
jgi:hypothetical protein